MDSFLTPIISAGISALVSYYVTIHTKDREYKNEYYKKVIDKRIASYEKVEKVLNSLYFASGDGGTMRFTVFDKPEDYHVLSDNIIDAIKSSMWLTHEAIKFLYAINQNIADAKKGKNLADKEQLTAVGILSYKAMSHNKIHLEQRLRFDMNHMHDVERFFNFRN